MFAVHVIVTQIVTYGINPKASEVKILVRLHYSPGWTADSEKYKIN
jgi:hypothetical protein